MKHPLHEEHVELFHSLPRGLIKQIHVEVFSPHFKELFQNGEPGDCMYFVVRGTMKYFHNDEEDFVKVSYDAVYTYACELALWLTWSHRGLMVAEGHVELVNLGAPAFQRTMRKSVCANQYALKILEYVKEDSLARLSDVIIDQSHLQGMAETCHHVVEAG